MKRHQWLSVLMLVLIASSCGLETVVTLPDPDAHFDDGTLVTETDLKFHHTQSTYSGTVFQGYEIYYKVYPVSVLQYGYLTADRDALAASPTVSTLVSGLGYSRLTASPTTSETTAGLEEVFVGLTSDVTVELSFASFLTAASSDATKQPTILISGSLAAKPYLYRASVLAGTSNQAFRALKSATSKNVDMSSWTSGSNQYEITFFVVAFGLSGSLEPIYSKPVPWGVIRTVKEP